MKCEFSFPWTYRTKFDAFSDIDNFSIISNFQFFDIDNFADNLTYANLSAFDNFFTIYRWPLPSGECMIVSQVSNITYDECIWIHSHELWSGVKLKILCWRTNLKIHPTEFKTNHIVLRKLSSWCYSWNYSLIQIRPHWTLFNCSKFLSKFLNSPILGWRPPNLMQAKSQPLLNVSKV